MKKKIISLTLAIMISLALCSCGAKNVDFYDEMVVTNGAMRDFAAQDSAYEKPKYSMEAEEVADMKPGVREEYSGGMTSDTATSITEPQSTRKIIYTSSYEIRTKDYDASIAALNNLCAKYGAYFENASTYGGYDGVERRSNYTIRVPVQNYNSFVGEAGTIGVIVSSSQNNSDVTEQYYDTEARLESAKIREKRVLEILKNSAKLDDVLALERELSDIRYEIETYTGSLRKLDSLVSYATVTINIRETSETVIPKTQVLTFGERVSRGFSSGMENFIDDIQDFIVELSYNFIGVIVFVVVVLIIVILIVRANKKRKLRRAKKVAEKAENSAAAQENDSAK